MSKYLVNARQARDNNNTEDAKRFYDMVRTDDPMNGEAMFFYQYYSLYEGKNGEIPTRFINIQKALEPSINAVVNSEDAPEEKMTIIAAIVNAYIPLTWTLNRYMNGLNTGTGANRVTVISASTISSTCEAGVIKLYGLGDLLESIFGENGAAKVLSIACWKEAITLQQKWYAYKYAGITPETYAEKIKAVEPEYEIPKKAGCIQLADKR